MSEADNQLLNKQGKHLFEVINSVCRKTRLTANFYVSPEVLTRNFEE